jgi:hypothetical protein
MELRFLRNKSETKFYKAWAEVRRKMKPLTLMDELTAILMIPVVLKAALLQEGADLPDGAEAPPADLIEYVSKMILHDVSAYYL